MRTGRLRGANADLALAVALGALFVAEAAGESGFEGKRPLSIVIGLTFSATLALRRRLPLVPVVAAAGLIEFANLAGPQGLAETAAFLFGVVIAIYSAGAYARGKMLVLAGAVVLAAIPLAAIEPGKGTSASDIGFFLMFFGGPFAVGQVMQRRRGRERALESRTVALEQEGEARAIAAVADERARIARELHDVVAHAVSVIVLQSRGARRQIDGEQREVREALDTIERLSTEALTEMRRLLSLLREQDEDLALAPQPTLRRVEPLVESVRAAGLSVDLMVDGRLDDLPPGLDVSGYRIVQEGLTNALKHAGPAHARVRITRGDNELAIEVSDDGNGAGAVTAAGGHGLVGMRERVEVYGGHLEAGPSAGGGFCLRARLPLEPAL